jgi:hypothetical protein
MEDEQEGDYWKTVKEGRMVFSFTIWLPTATLNLVPLIGQMITSKDAKIKHFNHKLAFDPCTFSCLLPHW